MKRRAFVLLARVTNAVVRALRLRRFRGADLLYLTTIGRRTGKSRTTPLLYLEAEGDWIVVASNGGADWEPGWWLNLQSGSPATVEAGGQRAPVTGAEIVGPERARVWEVLNEKVFNYNGYQAKVSRRIAVVRLTPSSA
jgi:deazaflavin-dependent oxidoreductase (nitroreductase family)